MAQRCQQRKLSTGQAGFLKRGGKVCAASSGSAFRISTTLSLCGIAAFI
jgi:hypothetical protein